MCVHVCVCVCVCMSMCVCAYLYIFVCVYLTKEILTRCFFGIWYIIILLYTRFPKSGQNRFKTYFLPLDIIYVYAHQYAYENMDMRIYV